jgi:diguanylate cyclase (GGDEF)-like protein
MLVVVLLSLAWVLIIKRAEDDNARVVQDALTNHANIAHAVTNHSAQLLERLRFYSQMLVRNPANASIQHMVQSALVQDQSFLRIMQFDRRGDCIFSTGRKPEPWLREAATEFAARPRLGQAEQFTVGRVPPLQFAHVWNLPIFLRPALPGQTSSGFTVALVDLGYFSKRFADMDLGKSGEIVLAASDGRELLRIHRGQLDTSESITDSRPFRQAFAEERGWLSEQGADGHERLYAFQRIAASPLAVLVSRARDDVLKTNQAIHRSYWAAALFLSLLMLILTFLWMSASRRRQELIHKLTLAQENNLRLINQIGSEKEVAYRLATHDKLTGLPNRMLFGDLAQRFIGRAKRLRGRFAVLFIDLDHFKPINDTHGHKAGDQLLFQVALRLQECMRTSDVVARFGGDEFVALVADLRDSRDIERIAGKIIARLGQPYLDIVAGALTVSPSIGIAFYPEDSEHIDVLLREADAAMYQAKERGRATYAFADPALNRRIEQRQRIAAALPAALAQHEFHLDYQPRVSLRDFSITGLEALARWRQPQLGEIEAGDFIPVAEECGAILALGDYLIEAVCEQLEQWLCAGVPLVPVAIKLSPLQLQSPHLHDFIVRTLRRYGIAAHYLEFEIAESALIETPELIERLSRLSALGLRLAIAGFGSAHSGPGHLRALPAHYLKIDRALINEIRNDSSDTAIVSNTISLAHNLNLQTIAEGVETPEQVAHLRAARCDQAQGFYFSPPCPGAAIGRLLSHKKIKTHMNEGAHP